MKRRSVLRSGSILAATAFSAVTLPRLFDDTYNGLSMKIPITMCHGLNSHLTIDRFHEYLKIACDLGFESINYDQLYDWMMGTGSLPKKPIMFDFDHPILNIQSEISPLMEEYGYHGNLCWK